MKKLLAIIMTAMMLLTCVSMFSFGAAAATNVVYVKDGGIGDGTSADKAMADLANAYSTLATSGGTIVICGTYDLAKAPGNTGNYFVEPDHTGAITVTQVYGGTDYRTDGGAVTVTADTRWALNGPTTFENVTFKKTAGNCVIFVAQYNKLVMGEGVVCDGFTFGALGSSTTILGGFQKGFDKANEAELKLDLDSDITVKSGKFMIIGNSRQFSGTTFTGKSNITIDGGEVTKLWAGTVNGGKTSGDCTVTINGGNFLSAMEATNSGAAAGNVTFNINGGTFAADAKIKVSDTDETGKTVVNIVKTLSNAEAIKAAITGGGTVNMVEPAADTTNTTTSTDSTTNAPTTSKPTDNPSTGDMTVVFAAFAALSIAACVSIVIAKKVKEN